MYDTVMYAISELPPRITVKCGNGDYVNEDNSKTIRPVGNFGHQRVSPEKVVSNSPNNKEKRKKSEN